MIEEERSREENHVEEDQEVVNQHGIDNAVLKRQKLSRKKLVKPESFDFEAGNFTSYQGPGSNQVMHKFFFLFLFLLYQNIINIFGVL